MGTRSARDRFVLDHLGLVEPIARRMRRKLPDSFELQDLVQEGIFGLFTAARTYDPSHGTSEKTWAQRKIRHAIQEAVHGKPYHYAVSKASLQIVERAIGTEAEPARPLHPELEGVLATLTTVQRELIELIYYGNETLYSLRKRKALGLGWRRLKQEHDEALERLRPLLKKAA